MRAIKEALELPELIGFVIVRETHAYQLQSFSFHVDGNLEGLLMSFLCTFREPLFCHIATTCLYHLPHIPFT